VLKLENLKGQLGLKNSDALEDLIIETINDDFIEGTINRKLGIFRVICWVAVIL
jgi:hypothetical protein